MLQTRQGSGLEKLENWDLGPPWGGGGGSLRNFKVCPQDGPAGRSCVHTTGRRVTGQDVLLPRLMLSRQTGGLHTFTQETQAFLFNARTHIHSVSPWMLIRFFTH